MAFIPELPAEGHITIFLIIYIISFKFRLVLGDVPINCFESLNPSPGRKFKGSETKRERIWEFCIEVFVQLENGNILKGRKLKGVEFRGKLN